MSTPFRLTESQRERIRLADDFWLATVKPDPAAHLIPIWAVLVGDTLYMGTETETQKVRNLRSHDRAALSLPDTRDVLVLEGTTHLLTPAAAPEGVLFRFHDKYGWTIRKDEELTLIEFVPDKVLSWNSEA